MPIHFESILSESFGSFPGYTGDKMHTSPSPRQIGRGEPKSQSIDLKIHSLGRIGNCCPSSSALTFFSVTLKNFAKA